MTIPEKKEGSVVLVADPTFIDIGNGRLKCVETGHELPIKELNSYTRSKRCRTGLIDAALLHSKHPLDAFKPHPLSRSKLICKLTGDTINKTEEHILKHINGKRFLAKLGKNYSGLGNERHCKPQTILGPSLKNSMDEDNKREIDKLVNEIREAHMDNSDTEEDEGFWLPSCESDNDKGSESEEKTIREYSSKECIVVSKELSKRTKRMTIEIGPSSFATRKKKNKH